MSEYTVAVGEVGVDILVGPVANIPSDWSEICTVDHIGIYTAGSAGYFAQCLSKLGKKCRVAGKIGKDAFGRLIRKELMANGVSVKYLRMRQGEKTEITLVLFFKDGKKIQFVTRIPRLTIDDIDPHCLQNVELVHFSGYLLFPEMWGKGTERLLRKAREMGARTSLDPQASITGDWKSAFDRILTHVDLLMLDETEAKTITGYDSFEEASEKFLRMGTGMVVVKLGKRGCCVNDGKRFIEVPGYSVPSISTVGAGDAFDAGFVYGLAKNWTLQETAKFANAVAAISTTKFGCKTAIQDEAYVRNFMAREKPCLSRIELED